MDIDDLIDQFVEDLEFDVLIIWPDCESELRVAVGDAMRKVGMKK